MKKYYFILVIVFLSVIANAQNFADTKGELQISDAGQATYTLPIAMPPSIKNVAPIINLTYNSGVRGGIAGQGWNINSISSICRIATRRDIDGFVDGVDFDSSDKLALDGQRLILKNPAATYWANGTVYETEYKSNTKIELMIEPSGNGPITYFIVTGHDGSRTWYGSTGNGVLQNAASVNAWYIIRHEDVFGNYITYNYSTVVYNNTNQLYISD
ncbi:MAG TPA: SpvB/TcaC N-terminal domain-containing protein, partial [Flavobacterium sp.]|nr:SpvB/TcaC N-terminal domain-containing protein [Flavobacterium sp.]